LPSLVIVPILLFSLSPNKDARYILPVFVPIAIMMAKLIESIDRYKIVTFVIVLFSIIQYFLVSFIPNDIFWLRTIKDITLEYDDNQKGVYTVGKKSNWRTKEIIQLFTKDIKYEQDHIQVLVIPSFINLHHPLKIFAKLKGMPIDFVCPAEWDQSVKVPLDFDSIVLNSDYVITKTGNLGFVRLIDYRNRIRKSFIKYKDKFFILKKFILTDIDGSTLYIYKRYKN
jgi:hypothetical protein